MPQKEKSTSITRTNLTSQLRQHKLLVLVGILLAGAVYAAVPQLGILGNSWAILLDSDWSLAAVAVCVLLVSYACASGMYMLLVPRRLSFARTYVVQVAGSFASRALPAGIGSISVNYLYLRAQKLSQVIAGSVVALNNLIGFVGHMLWVAIAIIYAPTQLISPPTNLAGSVWFVVSLLMLVVLVGWVFRMRLRRGLASIVLQLRRTHPGLRQLAVALVLSMMLTACYIVMLWLSGRALGLTYGFVTAVIALTVGVAAQTITPTPGGLGGAEAGLVGGLVLGGVPAGNALAAVLLYRVITYWLPLGLGAVALWIAVRYKYI